MREHRCRRELENKNLNSVVPLHHFRSEFSFFRKISEDLRDKLDRLYRSNDTDFYWVTFLRNIKRKSIFLRDRFRLMIVSLDYRKMTEKYR